METFAAIPIITGVVQALKMAFLPSKLAGLLSIILGLLFSFGTNHAVTVETTITGIVIGLSASGLYEGVKTGAEPTKNLIGKMVK